MGPDEYNWLRVGHVIGFVLWIGGMVSVLQLLRVHSAVEGAARDVLARHERKMALVMDVGAMLTLVCGLVTALGGTTNYFTTGAWLHIKVTIVAVVILGMHGWARVQVKRFRKGQVRSIPVAVTYVVLIAAAAVILLAAHRGLLRKG
jgi:putative membrane protein